MEIHSGKDFLSWPPLSFLGCFPLSFWGVFNFRKEQPYFRCHIGDVWLAPRGDCEVEVMEKLGYRSGAALLLVPGATWISAYGTHSPGRGSADPWGAPEGLRPQVQVKQAPFFVTGVFVPSCLYSSQDTYHTSVADLSKCSHHQGDSSFVKCHYIRL